MFTNFERIARAAMTRPQKLPKIVPMTIYTQKHLKAELKKLESQVDHALEMVGETGGTSDWHDNFAFDQANRDFDFYSLNKHLIRNLLHRAKIIPPRREIDLIGLGNSTSIYFEKGKKTRELTLLGELDSGRKPNWISASSPLGRKLIGRKAGEWIRVKLQGKSQLIQVISIHSGDIE